MLGLRSIMSFKALCDGEISTGDNLLGGGGHCAYIAAIPTIIR
jgi:hypothetical protein